MDIITNQIIQYIRLLFVLLFFYTAIFSVNTFTLILPHAWQDKTIASRCKCTNQSKPRAHIYNWHCERAKQQYPIKIALLCLILSPVPVSPCHIGEVVGERFVWFENWSNRWEKNLNYTLTQNQQWCLLLYKDVYKPYPNRYQIYILKRQYGCFLFSRDITFYYISLMLPKWILSLQIVIYDILPI